MAHQPPLPPAFQTEMRQSHFALLRRYQRRERPKLELRFERLQFVRGKLLQQPIGHIRLEA
jgi:hypothetical protein